MTFRCYGPLNDFLPIERRQVSFSVPFAGERSVKDAIESIGVAHVEVDLIVVNGDPALFNALVSDGNRIAVFPWFRSIDRELSMSCSYASKRWSKSALTRGVRFSGRGRRRSSGEASTLT